MATAALVLPGGGIKCGIQVWWCEELIPRLIRNKIGIPIITGSSGGAMNAAKLGESDTDDELMNALEELGSIWFAIDRRGSEVIFPIGNLTFITHVFSPSLLDGKTLWGLVDGGLFKHKPLDAGRIVKSNRQVDILVTNKITRKQEFFSNKDERVRNDPELIIKATVASASRHPFFPPVAINGVPYADGENILLKRVFQLDCDFVFILFPYPKDYIETPGDDWFSRHFRIIMETFTALSAKIQEAEQREVEVAVEKAGDIRVWDEFHQKMAAHVWYKPLLWFFSTLPFSFRGKKAPRIVPVYLEHQPPHLKTHSSRPGDLSKMREGCRTQMRAILAELDLL